jgi:hypothetical protein
MADLDGTARRGGVVGAGTVWALGQMARARKIEHHFNRDTDMSAAVRSEYVVVLDLENDDEVNYLAKKYGVTPARVREAAREAGATFAAVEETLTRSDPHAPE